MKTIIKEFWVSSYHFKQYTSLIGLGESSNLTLCGSKSDSSDMLIKISWEEPEKKIEITESDFDMIVTKATYYPQHINSLKKQYFGGK